MQPAILVVGSTIVPPYTEARSFILAWSLMLSTVIEAVYIAFYKMPFTKTVVLIVFLFLYSFKLRRFQSIQIFPIGKIKEIITSEVKRVLQTV